MKNIKIGTSSNGLACIEYTRHYNVKQPKDNVLVPRADDMTLTPEQLESYKNLGYIFLYCGNSKIEPKYEGSEGMKDYYSFKSVEERTQFLREVYDYKGGK